MSTRILEPVARNVVDLSGEPGYNGARRDDAQFHLLGQPTLTTIKPTLRSAPRKQHVHAFGLGLWAALWSGPCDLASTALGAIIFDVAGTGSGTGTTVDVTGPTVGSGPKRVLLVAIAQGNSAATLTSVTWDQGGTNQALTSIASKSNLTDTRIELWRLVGPTSGAKTLRIVSPSSVGMAVGIVAYSGVDQTTPEDTPPAGTSGTPGTTPSITVTSTAGDVVVDAVATKEDLTNKTAGTNQTERAQLGAGDELVAMSQEAGASSVAMTWSGSFQEWAQVGVSLNPARRVMIIGKSGGPIPDGAP